jgi:chromosome segregation ATPase
MKKTMTIDYDEYMSHLDDKDNLRKEIEKFRKELFNKNQELKFIKENAEEILVIEKSIDGTIIESKRKEKDAISEIVTENIKLMNRIHDLKDEISELKEKNSLIIEDFEDIKQNYNLIIDNLNKKIKNLTSRSLFNRIFNKK